MAPGVTTPRPTTPLSTSAHAPNPSALTTTKLTATTTTTTTIHPPVRSTAPKPTQPTRTQLHHALSTSQTHALIRRSLFPSAPRDATLSSLLTPLTGNEDVDIEIYALIAVVMREGVWKWYGNVTGDVGFGSEVGGLIGGVVGEVVKRAGEGGWEGRVMEVGEGFGEVGGGHIDAYRTAHTPRLPAPYTTDPQQIYHALHPHPALSPVPRASDPDSTDLQKANEAAYRELLTRNILTVLLPPSERENDALMALVGAILADLVMGKAVERVCEPGMIWEGVVKVAEAAKGKRLGERNGEGGGENRQKGKRWQAVIWMLLQCAFVAFSVLRALVVALATASSLPRRGRHGGKSGKSVSTPLPTPVLGMKIWSFLARMVELEERMPWTYGALALLQWGMLYGPGRIGAVDGVVDRLLTSTLLSFLPPAAPTLRTIRALLFPLNALPPPGAPPPTGEEALRLRRRAAEALLNLVPTAVRAVYLGTEKADRQVEEVEGMLGVWGDEWMNRFVAYSLIEAGVVGVLPEIAGAEGGAEEGRGELEGEEVMVDVV